MYNFDEIIDRRGTNALFVGNAEGCIRLNLAMPRSIIKTGLERMRDSIRVDKGAQGVKCRQLHGAGRMRCC